jgi:hypothetical protein
VIVELTGTQLSFLSFAVGDVFEKTEKTTKCEHIKFEWWGAFCAEVFSQLLFSVVFT